MAHFSQMKLCIGCGETIKRNLRQCPECASDQFINLKSMCDALILPQKISYRLNKMLSPRNGNGFSEERSLDD